MSLRRSLRVRVASIRCSGADEAAPTSRDRLRESRESANGTTRDVSRGVSDNDRKYYSIKRAKEVLGYDPQDNSAEWNGDEKVDST